MNVLDYSKPVPNSNPQFVGFNQADFCLTPVVKKGQSHMLANTKHRHEWVGVTKSGKKKFHVERKYGDVPPNMYTEDFLLILGTKAYQRDDPTKIPVSKTSFLTIQGYSSWPGGDNLAKVITHLDALQETRIDTNALYNRNTGSWYGFRGRPIGGFTYIDDTGKLRESVDKKGQKVVQVIKELGTASITTEFYEAFLLDCIELDFTKYFNVGGPTARRLYKMGMKYILTLGDFELDLQECCIARLGMLPDKVLSVAPSALARNIRPEARRVSETEDLVCVVEKSQTHSGYKICFRPNVVQLSLPGLPPTLQGKEKEACSELKKRKINPKLAYDLVIEARRFGGNKGPKYIKWVLREYDRENKAGKVGPGVIKHRIHSWDFRSRFEDFLQAQRVRANQKEARLYPEGANAIGSLFGQDDSYLLKIKDEDESVYKLIIDTIEAEYSPQRLKDLGHGHIEPERLQIMKANAMSTYARKTLQEWRQGNTGFRPF